MIQTEELLQELLDQKQNPETLIELYKLHETFKHEVTLAKIQTEKAIEQSKDAIKIAKIKYKSKTDQAKIENDYVIGE